ncbi:putative cytochrome P450 313a4 [Cochliomyia hominivorax]
MIFCKIFLVRKIFEFTRFKNAVKGQAMFRELINESKDIILKGDTTDSKQFPHVKSILEYALNGVNENILTMNDVPGEMMQFLGAAYDTISKTLHLTILMLAMHPEYQDRAYEEISSVLTDQNDDNLSIEQLNELTYLEMTINETMRIAPAIPMIAREIGKNSTSVNNIILPPGLCVVIDLFRLHRRKDLWGDNAHLFNPDNFLPSNVATRHPYSFIPFAKGLRFCIGKKYALLLMKTALAKLIQRYKFSTDFKYENLRFQNYVSIKLEEEPLIDVERREKGNSL